MRSLARYLGLVIIVALGIAALPVRSVASPMAWVSRPIVLPRGEAAIDLGLGLGRRDWAPEPYGRGTGLNLELAVGVAWGVELGFRTGFHLGGDLLSTYQRPDHYGRLFETETYWSGGDDVANPEIKLRFAIAYGPVAELALDMRAYLPFDGGPFGTMIGLPLRLHAGALRIDTGLYFPILFSDPEYWAVSIPMHFWIQASNTVWFGPLLGFRSWREADARWTTVPFGFGLGVAIAHNADFRAWFLFPDIRNNEHEFGGGVSIQIRF